MALSALLGTVVGACAGSTGRVPAPAGPRVGAMTSEPLARDELLADTGAAIWRGNLAAAEVALTALADREHGRADSTLDFWSELLALLRCEPLGRVPQAGRGDPTLADPWDRLRRLVQIERVRLGRELPAPPKNGRLIARLDAPTGARAAREVTWPVEGERWSDETAVPVLVTRCVAAGETGSVRTGLTPAADAEMTLVAATARAMPPGHPATAPLLLQAGVLEMTHGRAVPAVATLAELEAAGGVLDARERTQAVFAAALASIDDPPIAPDVGARAAGAPRSRSTCRPSCVARWRSSSPSGSTRPSGVTTRWRSSARPRTATTPSGATSPSARWWPTRGPGGGPSCSPRRARRCTVTGAPTSTPIRRSAR